MSHRALTERLVFVGDDEIRLTTTHAEAGRYTWTITRNGNALEQGEDYPTHYDALAAGFERFNFYTPAF